MKKFLSKLLYLLMIVVILIANTPIVTAYEFQNPENENAIKRERKYIYLFADMYYDVVGKNSSSFSLLNYSGVCSMVTVNGKTYQLDEYVAGVLKAEVGVYVDYPEFLKAQAIAARSFLIASKSDGASCTVDSGEHFQVFSEIDPNNANDQIYLEAAKATSGMVVMRDGKVALTQYMSYPNSNYSYDVNGKWTVELVKFGDDPSTAWTWVGSKTKDEIQSALGYHAGGVSLSSNHHNGMSQVIGAWLGHEGYSYEEIIDLFYGTSKTELATLADGNYTANIEYVDSEFGKIWYYNQGDYPNYYYSSNVNEPQYVGSSGNWATIASHGCGPTSLAIVLSSFEDREINPMTVTQQTCQAGGCTGGGTYFYKLVDIAQSYGYKVETVGKNGNVAKVTNALATGDSLVIALMGPGIFTSGGHFIVLTGTRRDGSVSVADPASRSRTEQKWFSFNTVVQQAKTSGFIIITK